MFVESVFSQSAKQIPQTEIFVGGKQSYFVWFKFPCVPSLGKGELINR